MRPSPTASPIYLYACSQRILGVSPSPLAPRPHTATPAARDSNLGSDNHDMSRLPTPAYPNDAPIYGLTDIYTSAPALNGYWVCRPRPSLSPRHGNTHCSRLKPRQWQPRPVWGGYLHSHTRATRPSTPALPINLYAYPLPTDIGWCPGPRTQNRHTTQQLWPQKRPHGHQTTYMHLLSVLVGPRTSTWPLPPFVQPEHA
jgi:hypothetical protein